MSKMSRKTEMRWRQQQERCFWCGRWCWLEGVTPVGLVWERLGSRGATLGAAKDRRKRRATAEHLIPKSSGGTNAATNIVCACHDCNTRRGNDPSSFQPHPAVLKIVLQRSRRSLGKVLPALHELGFIPADFRPSQDDHAEPHQPHPETGPARS